MDLHRCRNSRHLETNGKLSLKEKIMALTKNQMNDKVEVLHLAAGYPVVQVRTATVILDDGVEISRQFHRHVITP